MSDDLLFSVIICTYNRYDLLPAAIASAAQQTIDPACYDIWVIDNSPASEMRAAMQAHYAGHPALHYITRDTPGLSHARNEAARRATGRYLVFLDDDAEAVPDWLQHYKDALALFGPDVGCIGGPVDPAFAIPRPAWLGDKLLVYLSVYDGGPQAAELAVIGHGPVGANVLFDRDSVNRCGGFATGMGRQGEGSLLSGEESELCDRIRDSGKKLFYAPGPRVMHHIPAERLTRAWFRRRAAWQAISVQMNRPLTREEALQMWPLIIDYLRKVPREHVAFMGLLWDTDDPAIFEHQMACIQFHTRILISQGAYPPEMMAG